MLKASVIMAIYNVENYLEEALNSIINQTLKEIEIILINDGSTDKSLEIAEKYAEKDKRIRIINQRNCGVSLARNIGIKNSNGKYVYFMDSDDFIELDTLEECFEICEEENLDMVYFSAISFWDENKFKFDEKRYTKAGKIQEYKIYTGAEFLEECIKKNKYTTPVWLYFFKKEYTERLSFYPNIIHEDNLFTTILLNKIKRLKYINRNFYHRRYRKNSIMASKLSKKNIESLLIIIKEFEKEYYSEKNIMKKNNLKLIIFETINSLVTKIILGNFKEEKLYLSIILKEYKRYLSKKVLLKIKLKNLYKVYYKLNTNKLG